MANSLKQRKYFFIYKTTNLLNGKYYIGMHSTNNLKDGYLGSGSYLRRSIRKYGKENFKCEILEYCNSREELIQREEEIVNEGLVKDFFCMNLKLGGIGGFCNEEHKKRWENGRNWGRVIGGKNSQQRFRNDIEKVQARSLKASKTLKEIYTTRPGNFYKKKHSKETKHKISKTKKGKNTGNKNSQYGTCWVTKEGINKKIKKEELETYLALNWKQGRIFHSKKE